ncbi:MAG: hypothetical protein J6T10_23995 [Methanobrevibacter sp.]|nr:hypothetical protein [Methanobrevibacter sp.]
MDIKDYVSGRLTVLEKRFSSGKYITFDEKTLLYGRVSELEALLDSVGYFDGALYDRVHAFLKMIFD